MQVAVPGLTSAPPHRQRLTPRSAQIIATMKTKTAKPTVVSVPTPGLPHSLLAPPPMEITNLGTAPVAAPQIANSAGAKIMVQQPAKGKYIHFEYNAVREV